MTTLRRWKLARGRAQSLGLPEQAPNEQLDAKPGKEESAVIYEDQSLEDATGHHYSRDFWRGSISVLA